VPVAGCGRRRISANQSLAGLRYLRDRGTSKRVSPGTWNRPQILGHRIGRDIVAVGRGGYYYGNGKLGRPGDEFSSHSRGGECSFAGGGRMFFTMQVVPRARDSADFTPNGGRIGRIREGNLGRGWRNGNCGHCRITLSLKTATFIEAGVKHDCLRRCKKARIGGRRNLCSSNWWRPHGMQLAGG